MKKNNFLLKFSVILGLSLSVFTFAEPDQAITEENTSKQNMAEDIKGTVAPWLNLEHSLINNDLKNIVSQVNNISEKLPQSLFLKEKGYLISSISGDFDQAINYGNEYLELASLYEIVDNPTTLNISIMTKTYQTLKDFKEGKISKEEAFANLPNIDSKENNLNIIDTIIIEIAKVRLAPSAEVVTNSLKKLNAISKAYGLYYAIEVAYMEKDIFQLSQNLLNNPAIITLLSPAQITNYTTFLKNNDMLLEADRIINIWQSTYTERKFMDFTKVTDKVFAKTEIAALANDYLFFGNFINSQYRESSSGLFYQINHWLNPSPQSYVFIAGHYANIQDFELAIENIDVLRDDPVFADISQVYKLIFLIDAEQYDEALEIAMLLEQKYPQSYIIADFKGDIYRRTRDLKKAELASQDVIKFMKEDEEVYNKQGWAVHYQLGVLQEQQGDWESAQNNLKESIALKKDNQYALNYLAYSWANNGVNLEEAKTMLLDAVAKSPNNGHIVDSLGWLYYRQGNLALALSTLERALQLEPQPAEINDHYADALWYAGYKKEAMYHWQRAVDLDEDSETPAAGIDMVKEKLKYKRPFVAPGEKPLSAEQKQKIKDGKFEFVQDDDIADILETQIIIDEESSAS